MSCILFNTSFPPRDDTEKQVFKIALRLQPNLALQDALGLLIADALAYQTGGRLIAHFDDSDPDPLQEINPYQLVSQIFKLGVTPQEYYELGDFGPYLWSERHRIYHDVAMYLVETGYAFHCFCARRYDHLFQWTANPHQACQRLSEDQVCERLVDGESYLIRFRVPDKLRDQIGEDFALLTPEGAPLPHFAHVADNHLMQVTTQVRRRSTQSMWAKEMLLSQALGWGLPNMVFVPEIHDPAVTKPFDDAPHMNQFCLDEYRRKALVNFLAHFVWKPADGRIIFQHDEFRRGFDLNHLPTETLTMDYSLLNRIQGGYNMK